MNAKGIDGTTALMWAAGGGHSEIVKILQGAGADVSAACSGVRTFNGLRDTEIVDLFLIAEIM